MGEDVRITVIATGFDGEEGPERTKSPAQRRMETQDLFNEGVLDRDNIEIPAFLRRRG
jgi:hypothetical protein